MASLPLLMRSFSPSFRAVVVGGGGIGGAVHSALASSSRCGGALSLSRRQSADIPIDILDESSIKSAAAEVAKDGPVHLVFVATGVLQDDAAKIRPEKSYTMLNAEAMAKVYAVNTIAPTLVAKHFLPLLAKDSKSVFAAVSARVGSIDDNALGGWHSYRASKTALNMFIKTMSIELARINKSALCVALHPGTVATPLSVPFQRNVRPEKLFTPERAADQMLQVIDGLSPKTDTGGFFAYDGKRIPY